MLFLVFNYFILPCRKFMGPLTQVKQSICKSNAIYSYQCVQYFRVSKQWYGWVYRIFNVCTGVSACDCTQMKYRPCNFCWTSSAFRMVCWEKGWSVNVFLMHKSSSWRSQSCASLLILRIIFDLCYFTQPYGSKQYSVHTFLFDCYGVNHHVQMYIASMHWTGARHTKCLTCASPVSYRYVSDSGVTQICWKLDVCTALTLVSPMVVGVTWFYYPPPSPPQKCVCVCVHLYACGHVCMHVCLCVWVIKSLISNMVSNECDPLKLHCNPLAFHHTSLVWCTNIFCPIVEFSWKRRSTSTSKLQVVMHQVIPPTTWNTGKNTCQINTELRYLYYHRVGPP